MTAPSNGSTLKPLPTALPTDNTPNTHSATNWKVYLVNDNATSIIEPADIVVKTAAAKDAVTVTVNALVVPVAANTTLDFGGVQVKVTEDAAIGATSLKVAALPAALPAGSTALGAGTLTEVPLATQLQPNLTSTKESLSVFGRVTPIRITNGKDFTMSLETLGGVDDPTVAALVNKGDMTSPANKGRVVLKATDGYALLATVNIEHKISGQPGQSQKHGFDLELSGKMFTANLNDATPTWKQIGVAS